MSCPKIKKQPFLVIAWLYCFFVCFAPELGVAETSQRGRAPAGKGNDNGPAIDFESEDTFIDAQEAVRSKQYVRRAILSTVVSTTGKFNFGRIYVNHLMGFTAVYQKTNNFAKYTSGMQGLSLGYVTEGGHALEAGLELSAVSNAFAGYRYILRPEKFSIWPFGGFGLGQEVTSIHFADGPPQAREYPGTRKLAFGTLGVLIPLVEVGLKVEFRFNFYGNDRLVLSQGIGAIIFL